MMGLLSSIKRAFSPKAQYEGAKMPMRRKAAWDYSGGGAVASTSAYVGPLRTRARSAVRNDPWAAHALDAKVSDLIGTGITPRPATDDEALRSLLVDLWDEWSDECDANGVLDIYGIQALVARSWYESGEVFVRLRTRYPEDMSVPLQVQVIESDQVSMMNEDLEGGNTVRSGVEFDAIGRRVAYWIHPVHPGDSALKKAGDSNAPRRVPASEVLHVFKPLRPGQIRGVSMYAQVLSKFESLNKFDDAILFRQELANLFVAFIRKNPDLAPVMEMGDGTLVDAADVVEETLLKPGAARVLEPGEDVQFSQPPDAGSNYPDFMRQQLLALAAGVGMPYELLSGDYSRVNDRTIRVALNQYRRALEQDQWQVMIAQFLKPLRKAWVGTAILSGHLAMAQREQAVRTHWTPHAHAYIHPVQDVQANVMAVDAGFKSRAEVIRERGYDIDEVDAERLADGLAVVSAGGVD